MEVLNKEKVLEFAKKLIDEGKIDRAIAEYKKLLDVDPKDMRIQIRIAELLMRQKKVQDAVNVYKQVAESYTVDGFYLKAVTVYKNILRLNPSLLEINYHLAELYEKMGLAKDAIHQYQILSNMLEQKRDYKNLADVRGRIVALDPDNVANRIRLAETYQSQGDEEKSLDEYEKLIEDVRDTGKTDQLIELYVKVLSHRPDNIDMIRHLCKIYYKRGEWKKVVSSLEKKTELIAKEADLILLLADVYFRLNQVESSKNKYKEAAALFIGSGDVDKAADAFREALVVSPDSEEEIKELVTELDADLFAKVKSEAEEKRKVLEERMAARGEGEAASGEKEIENVPVPAAGRGAVPPSDKEAKKNLREADSAFELGKAYHQMGLVSESGPELSKALGLYKALVEGGYKDDRVSENMTKIGEWLGMGGETAPENIKAVEEETLDFPASAPKAPEPRPEVGKKVEKPKEQEAAPPKKKKDKRMGFV